MPIKSTVPEVSFRISLEAIAEALTRLHEDEVAKLRRQLTPIQIWNLASQWRLRVLR